MKENVANIWWLIFIKQHIYLCLKVQFQKSNFIFIHLGIFSYKVPQPALEWLTPARYKECHAIAWLLEVTGFPSFQILFSHMLFLHNRWTLDCPLLYELAPGISANLELSSRTKMAPLNVNIIRPIFVCSCGWLSTFTFTGTNYGNGF